MLTALCRRPPDVILTSDASGSWGCGAFSGVEWFQCLWNGRWTEVHITVKELIPIVIAGAIWGKTGVVNISSADATMRL